LVSGLIAELVTFFGGYGSLPSMEAVSHSAPFPLALAYLMYGLTGLWVMFRMRRWRRYTRTRYFHVAVASWAVFVIGLLPARICPTPHVDNIACTATLLLALGLVLTLPSRRRTLAVESSPSGPA
jgi:hypothetical protein